MQNSQNKLTIFKSLFKGREDVFAIRWQKGGKSGYMPAYFYDPYHFRIYKLNGGSFKDYADKTYLRLTDDQIEKHLTGQQVIGLYPLLPDNSLLYPPILNVLNPATAGMSGYFSISLILPSKVEKLYCHCLYNPVLLQASIKVLHLTDYFPIRITFRVKVLVI